MQIRILVTCALGSIACEPQPLLIVQTIPTPATAYVQSSACVRPASYAASYAQTCSAENVRTSCNEVRHACETGGFYPGGMVVGKGIKVDCLEPLMRGADISVSMSVRPEEIACINAEWSRARARSENDANDFENTCIYGDTSSKRQACDDVVRACAAGGYYSGGMDVGLGVLVDCIEPLRSGRHPARVNVAPATLHACFGPNLDDAEGDRMASDRAPDLAPPPRMPRRH